MGGLEFILLGSAISIVTIGLCGMWHTAGQEVKGK
ncbi:hypothetical protein JOD21_000354 [Jeotgalibacillus terrae]|nr:hypothetical protein [Jeotgalibacillus terrae]